MIKNGDRSPLSEEPSPSGRGQGEGSRPPSDGAGKVSSPSPHPNPLREGEGTVHRPNRRRVVVLLGATGALATLGLPRAVFAAAPT